MQRSLDDVEIDLVAEERAHLAYLARVAGPSTDDATRRLSTWAEELALLEELWAEPHPA